MKYLVVQFAGMPDNLVVPETWIKEGKCFWPPQKPELKAKSGVMMSPHWASYPVRVLSVQATYADANERREMIEAESESGKRFVAAHASGASTAVKRSRTPAQLAHGAVAFDSEDLESDRENTLPPPLPPSKILKRAVKSSSNLQSLNCSTFSFDRTSSNDLQESFFPPVIDKGFSTTITDEHSLNFEDENFVDDVHEIQKDPVIRPSSSTSWPSTFASSTESVPVGGVAAIKHQNPSDSMISPRVRGFRSVKGKSLKAGGGKSTSFEITVSRNLKDLLRYTRFLARNVEDIKSELREHRRMMVRILSLLSSSPVNESSGTSRPTTPNHARHPVFEKELYMPLRTVEDFWSFEMQLEKPEIRQNLIEAIRAFGGDNIGEATRLAWKESMTDSLMTQFTWKGQLSCTSKKEKNLKLVDSKLASTIFEALKHGKFAEVTMVALVDRSKDYIRRAGVRIKAKKEKEVQIVANNSNNT